MYRRYLKRIMDVLLASIIILILLPLLVLIALLSLIQNRGGVFFLQKRAGLYGEPFKVIKFKTMNDRKDENGKFLPDDIRITRIGKWLRVFSLDEIPQLLNVVKGEMSIIGPRPLPMSYVERYSPIQRRRLNARPGITGYAQVNGRNNLDWDKRFELDVLYVDKLSFWMDITIIFNTIVKVLKRDGVLPDGKSSVDTFKGNNK